MRRTCERRDVRARRARVAPLVLALLLLVGAGGCSREDTAARPDAEVERVVDGDTIVLRDGTVVRLVQIDAPEVRGRECYADEATAALAELPPAGTPIRVEPDPALDQRDRYGRRLAYGFKNGENVNETLVELGAASVWFYGGARGRYATDLLAAAQDAQAEGRGLWGACGAILDPVHAVETGTAD